MNLLTYADVERRAAVLATQARPENIPDHEVAFGFRNLFLDNATALLRNIHGAQEDVVYGIREALRAGVQLPSPVVVEAGPHTKERPHGYMPCPGSGRLVPKLDREKDRTGDGAECRGCGEQVQTKHSRFCEHYLIFGSTERWRARAADAVTITLAPRRYAPPQGLCRTCGHKRFMHRLFRDQIRNQGPSVGWVWCMNSEGGPCYCAKWKKGGQRRGRP